jgi:hypothetical protein
MRRRLILKWPITQSTLVYLLGHQCAIEIASSFSFFILCLLNNNNKTKWFLVFQYIVYNFQLNECYLCMQMVVVVKHRLNEE